MSEKIAKDPNVTVAHHDSPLGVALVSDVPTQAPSEEGGADRTANRGVRIAPVDEDFIEDPSREDDGKESATERGDSGASSYSANLEQEGDAAADFLETLLDICDLDGDIDVAVESDRAAVSIVDSEEGRVPRRLVGDQGKVLDALQEITRLAVQTATGERSRLMLDIARFRADRRDQLVGVARAAIEKVRNSGERQALEPMNSFERKVVHDQVLSAGLVSESEGAEPSRYVVILPA